LELLLEEVVAALDDEFDAANELDAENSEDELESEASDVAALELTLEAFEEAEDGIGLGPVSPSPDEPPPQAVSTPLMSRAHRLRNA